MWQLINDVCLGECVDRWATHAAGQIATQDEEDGGDVRTPFDGTDPGKMQRSSGGLAATYKGNRTWLVGAGGSQGLKAAGPESRNR